MTAIATSTTPTATKTTDVPTLSDNKKQDEAMVQISFSFSSSELSSPVNKD
jgi:hypothetical protein